MINARIVLLTFMTFLYGCVGTVQDAAEPFTSIAANPKGVINFGGIHQAVPISQDKIELFFYPAIGGTSKYYYTFYVGDKPLPYTVPSETLTADYRGLLKYTVTGLEPAKTYVIKGEAIDQSTLDKDSNTITKTITTFPNLVSDFIGISAVYNTAGIEGIDSINVRWTHARIDYSNITGTASTDPKSYEIVAVDSDRLTPADMDKPQFLAENGRYVKILDYFPTQNEAIIRGLKSNTKYYVRVRAIHKNSVDDFNVPRLRGEKNTNYLTIKTLDNNLANIKKLETLTTAKNPGISQSNSLILSWEPVVGVYDHLRLLYTAAPNPLYVEIGVTCGVKPENQVSCRKIFGSTISTIIGNLSTAQPFNFQLVACQDAECSVSKSGPVITGNTNPTFAGFTGVQSVDIATVMEEVGKLFLRIPLPDFSKGDFDGYVIGFKNNNADDFVEISEVGHASMKIESYNHRTDTTIAISGIDYKVGGLYCFSVYPFVYNPDSTKTSQPNAVWKCNTPEVIAPDVRQFPGFSEASTFGYDLNIFWSAPAGGIYENFEVFMRTTPGVFSFPEAKAQVASGVPVDYIQVILPWYITKYTFSNLTAPKVYKVGIITRYIFGATDTVRSEDNEQTYVCLLDAAKVSGNFVLAPCSLGI